MEEIKYYTVSLGEIVEKLREYFKSRRHVDVAVLYGSTLRRSRVRDIDVAIHKQGGVSLDELIKISLELEQELKTPIDITPLEDLPPRLRIRILVKGIPLIVRNTTTYTELLKTSIAEAQDIELKIAYNQHNTK